MRLVHDQQRRRAHRLKSVWVMLVKNGSNYHRLLLAGRQHLDEVGSTSVNFSNATYLAGLAVTSHDSGTASTATFDNVSIAPSLPWLDGRRHRLALAGRLGHVRPLSLWGRGCGWGRLHGTGGGADIWNAADQFNFASQTASGDQTLVARVTSQTNTDSLGQGGRDVPRLSRPPEQRCSSTWWPRRATASRCSGGTRPERQCASATISERRRAQRIEPGVGEAGQERQPLYRLLFAGRHHLDEVGSTSVTFSNSRLPGRAGGHQPRQRHAMHGHLRQREPHRQRLRQPGPERPRDGLLDRFQRRRRGQRRGRQPGHRLDERACGTQLDPGRSRLDLSINEVQLNWGAAYASAYQIQVSSDGSSWTTIYSTTTGQGGVQDF